jgi:hypothetical protein
MKGSDRVELINRAGAMAYGPKERSILSLVFLFFFQCYYVFSVLIYYLILYKLHI